MLIYWCSDAFDDIVHQAEDILTFTPNKIPSILRGISKWTHYKINLQFWSLLNSVCFAISKCFLVHFRQGQQHPWVARDEERVIFKADRSFNKISFRTRFRYNTKQPFQNYTACRVIKQLTTFTILNCTILWPFKSLNLPGRKIPNSR